MMIVTLMTGVVLLSGALADPLLSQEAAPPSGPSSLDPSQTLPADSGLTLGTLPNGLTYYIRSNARPQKRLQLRLVIRAGSILEEESERGAAHFVEHMAFNGTHHFQKQELVDFLESVGARLGPDLNAFTGFEETVYGLQVPTDSAGVVEKAFQILEDWAHHVSFDSTEVERERSVIIEEWRQSRGSGARLWERHAPVLLGGGRYAERSPIGTRENLSRLDVDALRGFYETWYRPELMAVIAIGDLDREVLKRLVERHFDSIPVASETPPVPTFELAEHSQTLVGIAPDPEASQTLVSVYHKQRALEVRTVGDYRRSMVESLYSVLLGTRLDELSREPKPPFLVGSASLSHLTRSKRAFVLSAAMEDEGLLRGLRALLGEVARARKHGFTSSELRRAKADLLRLSETVVAGPPQSTGLAELCTWHFLHGIPLIAPAENHELVKVLLPGITLKEVNGVVHDLVRESDRVVLLSGPEKERLKLPSEHELLAVFAEVEAAELPTYEDIVSHERLVARPPARGRVVEERLIEEIDVLDWRLSNGPRVLLKRAPFEGGAIYFVAFSPGGHSTVSDDDYVPAATAAQVVKEGGLAQFSAVDLRKRLAGRLITLEPYIGELTEGLAGQASSRDAEVLFELIYLHFTAPRADSSSFAALQTRLKGIHENRWAQPESALWDTLQVVLTQGHRRSQPWTEATFDQMDLQTSLAVYRDRFADASDFTFIFVGSFETAGMRWLVETWLGGLPAAGRRETWRDVGRKRPEGVVQKTLRRGLEPKSDVVVAFHGPFRWSSQARLELLALADVLTLDLREALREETGGTYGVEVAATPTRYPREEYTLFVTFSCSPERRSELTQRLFQRIAELQSQGPATPLMSKIKEQLRRERETNLEESDFWLLTLENRLFNGEDPADILDGNRIQELSAEAIRDAARQYLDVKRYVEVIREPENGQTVDGGS